MGNTFTQPQGFPKHDHNLKSNDGLSMDSLPDDPLVLMLTITFMIIGMIAILTFGCIDRFWRFQKKLSK